jgi:putative Holliday junction resolvase
MRALGVDLGTVRIGLALTDPSRSIASPHDTLPAGDVAADDWPEQVAATIAGVAAEVGADTIVIGLPRALSGKETAGAASARNVADALRNATDAKVHLWDERLSSVEAERMLVNAGRRRRQRRQARDRVAAAIILQSWLQADATA